MLGKVMGPLCLLLLSTQVGTAQTGQTPEHASPALPSGFRALSPTEFEAKKKASTLQLRPFKGLPAEEVKARATELKFNIGAATVVQPVTDAAATLQYQTWNGNPANFGPGNALSAAIGHGFGYVQVSFQGSPGSTYLLDCAVQDNIPYTVISSFAQGYGALEGRQIPAGGHILIPFARAPENAGATAMISASDFSFYGCQLDTLR